MSKKSPADRLRRLRVAYILGALPAGGILASLLRSAAGLLTPHGAPDNPAAFSSFPLAESRVWLIGFSSGDRSATAEVHKAIALLRADDQSYAKLPASENPLTNRSQSASNSWAADALAASGPLYILDRQAAHQDHPHRRRQAQAQVRPMGPAPEYDSVHPVPDGVSPGKKPLWPPDPWRKPPKPP